MGATLGNVQAAIDACKAAAATRHNVGSQQQSFGDCGLETIRAMINRERAAHGLPPITEDELRQEAARKGGANLEHLKGLLHDHGVPAQFDDATPEKIAQAVADGRGVATFVHPYWYWPGAGGVQPDAMHEVSIIGVVYDENGQIKEYIINDTGLGKCGLHVNAKDFDQARPTTIGHDRYPIIVTDTPLP